MSTDAHFEVADMTTGKDSTDLPALEHDCPFLYLRLADMTSQEVA
jgi:hypothetical protein